MQFEELIFLLGILSQLCVNGLWTFRVMNLDSMMDEEDPWKKGLLFFIVSLFAFGFSIIGFLNNLNLIGAALFIMSGFLASISGFFSVVEALAILKWIHNKSAAYIPKRKKGT